MKNQMHWIKRLSPAILYIAATWTFHEHNYSEFVQNTWIAGCLIISVYMVISSLSVKRMITRLDYVCIALQLLIASCLSTELNHEGYLLSATFGILLGLQCIAVVLLKDIESQMGVEISMGVQEGIAFLFPSHNGLLLLTLFLMGSVPGNLLFLLEDLLLHELFLRHIVFCLSLLLSSSLSGISLYYAYTEVFCGRAPDSLPEKLRAEPAFALRVFLLLFIFLGLLPALFLKIPHPI